MDQKLLDEIEASGQCFPSSGNLHYLFLFAADLGPEWKRIRDGAPTLHGANMLGAVWRDEAGQHHFRWRWLYVPHDVKPFDPRCRRSWYGGELPPGFDEQVLIDSFRRTHPNLRVERVDGDKMKFEVALARLAQSARVNASVVTHEIEAAITRAHAMMRMGRG